MIHFLRCLTRSAFPTTHASTSPDAVGAIGVELLRFRAIEGKNRGMKNMGVFQNMFSGWWYTYPSERYESQLG